jgi:hypothetical protein
MIERTEKSSRRKLKCHQTVIQYYLLFIQFRTLPHNINTYRSTLTYSYLSQNIQKENLIVVILGYRSSEVLTVIKKAPVYLVYC